MNSHPIVGSPTPDTLLLQMQGPAVTQGWDVVNALSVERIDDLLAQQYVTKLANKAYLPPINGLVPIVGGISAQFIDVVLGPPLIQFSPTLDPQEANLSHITQWVWMEFDARPRSDCRTAVLG